MAQLTLISELENAFKETLIALDNPKGLVAMDIQDMNTYLENRRVLARGKVLPTFIKPYFLTPAQITDFQSVVMTVLSCQEKVIEMYFEDDRYRPLFELTEAEIPLVEIGGSRFRHIYFSRLDAIFPENGNYQFLEFNCDSPGGAFYSDLQWEALIRMEVFKLLGSKYRFIHEPYRPRVLQALKAAWKDHGKSGKPRIAVMGNPDVANVEEFKLFAELFREEGYESIFTDPWSCEYDGNTLRKDGQAIDLVYRRGILADYSKHVEETKPVVDAYRDGNVVFANPFSAKLGDNKNLLEVMTDEETEWLFTPKEREILKKHLPWTRMVKDRKTTYQGQTVELLRKMRSDRHSFVMKPNAEYGGKGVVIGREVDPKVWDDTIQLAMNQPYVVQEYVDIPQKEFPVIRDQTLVWEPKKINVNFFTFNGKFGGGFCRTSDSSVINISAGGALVSFCVAERVESKA